MTFEISGRVPVAAPAEQLWAVVTDWERQDRWIPATVVRIVSGDGRSVGSKVLAFTGLADIGFVDSMEIVEWAPPRRCVVRHTGKLVREELADGTITWMANAHAVEALIGALGQRYVRGKERSALDAAYAEAMAAAHAAFPDDQDVAVLFADAVMNTSPWDYWEVDGRTRRGRAGEASA